MSIVNGPSRMRTPAGGWRATANDWGADAFHEDSDSDDMLYPDERDRRAYRDVMADDF